MPRSTDSQAGSWGRAIRHQIRLGGVGPRGTADAGSGVGNQGRGTDSRGKTVQDANLHGSPFRGVAEQRLDASCVQQLGTDSCCIIAVAKSDSAHPAYGRSSHAAIIEQSDRDVQPLLTSSRQPVFSEDDQSCDWLLLHSVPSGVGVALVEVPPSLSLAPEQQ